MENQKTQELKKKAIISNKFLNGEMKNVPHHLQSFENFCEWGLSIDLDFSECEFFYNDIILLRQEYQNILEV